MLDLALIVSLLFFQVVFAEDPPNYFEPYSPIFTDKDVYTWTDKVEIMIVAPSWNAHKDAIDTIGTDSGHFITISTREHELKPYKLTETELNSGIFVGEVILTGFEHDADGDGEIDTNPRTLGSGPTDGFLQTDRDGAITISFEFADGVVLIETALINWNIGDVMFFQDRFLSDDQAVIRVIDPDMNLNPEAIDSVPIEIASDSDAAGITVVGIEISEDTGLFEATISFSQSHSSSGNRLFAIPGDSFYAKYEDNTLPSPYSKSDNLEIVTSAQLDFDMPSTERLDLNEVFIADQTGARLTQLTVNNQLQIVGKIQNVQDFEQNFVFLFQITDETGKVVSLSWISGQLEPGQLLDLSQSWNPSETGTYRVDTFVWESIKSPVPLSVPNSQSYFIQ